MSTKQKDEIKLSKKHGVNPTMGVCPWCGKPNGTIALLGELEDDAEAPKYMLLDYDPCDECAAKWAEGVALIEVSDTPIHEGQPEITSGVYPTGRMVVVEANETTGKPGDRFFIVPEDMEKILGLAETDDTLQ